MLLLLSGFGRGFVGLLKIWDSPSLRIYWGNHTLLRFRLLLIRRPAKITSCFKNVQRRRTMIRRDGWLSSCRKLHQAMHNLSSNIVSWQLNLDWCWCTYLVFLRFLYHFYTRSAATFYSFHVVHAYCLLSLLFLFCVKQTKRVVPKLKLKIMPVIQTSVGMPRGRGLNFRYLCSSPSLF